MKKVDFFKEKVIIITGSSSGIGRATSLALAQYGSKVVLASLLTITSATRISTHTFINPVVAVIIGWAFGGEALTREMLVASVLIVISVYLVLFQKAVIVKDAVEEAAVEGTAGEP